MTYKPTRIVLEVIRLSDSNTYFTGQTIECPYTDKCTKHPSCCGTCRRNTAKKDYYIPDKQDWYIPYPPTYIPWYPYPNYTGDVWCTTTTTYIRDNPGDGSECHIYDDC